MNVKSKNGLSVPELLQPGAHQMVATHLGTGFDLVGASKVMGGILAPGRAYLMVERTTALHFLFPFGSVVTITKLGTVKSDVEQEILELRKFAESSHTRVSDEFRLLVDPEEKERVEFGQVTIKTSEIDRLVLVASSFAQSNTLEHYENVAVELTDQCSGLTDRMAEGKMPPTGSKMLSFIGKSLGMRRELVSQLSVLDPPEAIWEDNSLDVLYHALRNNFEIQQRMRVVEHKLELVKETAQLVVSLNESRQSHFLEIVIIVLIAIEIVLYNFGH